MNKRFIMVYSTGKDSTLALHKMITAGYEAVALLTFVSKKTHNSFMHEHDTVYVEKICNHLSVPVVIAEIYHPRDMASILRTVIRMKEQYKADLLVTGDIDQRDAIQWNQKLAALADVRIMMPLLNMNHELCVHEVIEAGYKCIINTIYDERLPESLLGEVLDENTINRIRQYGVDVCGENGEFHTTVVDGPLFKSPINYCLGDIEKHKWYYRREIIINE